MENKKETAKWRIMIIGIGFVLGLALLLFGSGSGEGKGEKAASPDAESYRIAMQNELESLCRAYAGGGVKVFLTLGEGYAYSYATDSRGGVATIGSGSSESALVTSTKMPPVSGVGVVYEGDSPNTEAGLIELICSALGLPSNKIFIVGTKKIENRS